MILNKYEDFMQFIPTTFDSNQDVELYKEWVDIAELQAEMNFFGTALYNKIVELPENDSFKKLCQRYICHFALFEAIPNLDLILTNNGFAVVGGNGSQFVPASKDRVAALRLQEDIWQEKFKEMIICKLAQMKDFFELWEVKQPYVKSLFFGMNDLTMFTRSDGSRNPDSYREKAAGLNQWFEPLIYPAVSKDLCTAIIYRQYAGTITDKEKQLLEMIKQAAGLLIRTPDPSQSEVRLATKILASANAFIRRDRSEERRVGKEC